MQLEGEINRLRQLERTASTHHRVLPVRVLYEKLRKPSYTVERLNKAEFTAFLKQVKKDLPEKDVADVFPVFSRKGLDSSLRIRPPTKRSASKGEDPPTNVRRGAHTPAETPEPNKDLI